MQLNRKKRTEQKAQEAMLPFLEEKLVRAERNDGTGVKWGVIVPFHLVKVYTEETNVRVEIRVWAIWKGSRERAIEAYETADELALRPSPDGLLTFLNLHDWQIELIDEEGW